jgi:Mitochondrial ribosomal protein (VAR1)
MNYILKNKLKTKLIFKEINQNNLITAQKIPCPVNEWQNNIYTFNEKKLTTTLIKDRAVYSLLNSYFNLKPNTWIKENKIKRKWMNLKRIFISKPDIKHSSSKVNIIIYTFNKEKLYILKKLKNLNTMYISIWKYKKLGLRKNFKKSLKNWKFINKYLENGIISRFIINFKKHNIIKFFFSLLGKKKDLNLNQKYLSEKKNLFVLNLIKKSIHHSLKNILLYKKYTSILYLNNFKYNLNLLIGVKNILSKIYNKKVELKIISMKYFYLESGILTSAIVRKLNYRKNRLLRVLKKVIYSVKIPKLHPFLYIPAWASAGSKIMKKNYNLESSSVDAPLNFYSRTINSIPNIVFNDLNYKHVIGIRLEGKGRLTKRLTASRSVFKYKYRGSLKNIYSSYQELPAIMLKGFAKSNIQYVNINSKNRNGSFGVKSWVSSY